MAIADVDVFIGIDVGKSEHWATALTQDGKRVFDKILPNDEAPLGAVYRKLPNYAAFLVLVDQPFTIGVFRPSRLIEMNPW